MFASDLLVEFYNPMDDEAGMAELDDTRRPRLTLTHLQKLRKSRDAARYERLQHAQTLPEIYGQPAEQQPF
jgi:hypothetical protein